jgi:hypothetical protein
MWVVFGHPDPQAIAAAAAVALGVHLFVLLYEEPTLRRTFGADYKLYCQNVGRWWPRIRPWRKPKEIETTSEEEASWRKNEGEHRSMNSQRQVRVRARSDVKHIPEPPQIRDDRHRENNDPLDRYGYVVHKACKAE